MGVIILLVCSIMTLVGVFLPWLTMSVSYEGLSISIEASGWDLVSALSFMDWALAGSIDPYLVVGGAIAMVVGTLGAIIVTRTSEDPEGALRIFGGAAVLGAILAIIGAAWFMIDNMSDSFLEMAGINFGIGYGLWISLLAAIGGLLAAIAPMLLASRGSTLSDTSVISPYGSTDFGTLSPREIAEMKARGPAGGTTPPPTTGYPGQQPAMGAPEAMGNAGMTGATGASDATGPMGPMGQPSAMGATGAMGIGAVPTGTATEHFNRASDLEAMGEHEKAMAEYSKAIAADGNHAMSYFNRGSILMQQGKKAEASVDFQKAVETSDNPDLQRMAQVRIEELSR